MPQQEDPWSMGQPGDAAVGRFCPPSPAACGPEACSLLRGDMASSVVRAGSSGASATASLIAPLPCYLCLGFCCPELRPNESLTHEVSLKLAIVLQATLHGMRSCLQAPV